MSENNTAVKKEAPSLVKKIGETTYVVRVHFKEDGAETMEDKIKRMLRNEVANLDYSA